LVVQAEPTGFLAIPAAVIIGREITIASLREWMAELGLRKKIEVSWLGKFKTFAQMTAIVSLLYSDSLLGVPMRSVGYVFLYFSVFLTIWSMLIYLRDALPSMLEHR